TAAGLITLALEPFMVRRGARPARSVSAERITHRAPQYRGFDGYEQQHLANRRTVSASSPRAAARQCPVGAGDDDRRPVLAVDWHARRPRSAGPAVSVLSARAHTLVFRRPRSHHRPASRRRPIA